MPGRSALLAIAFALLSAAAAAQQAPRDIRFLFTGDIMMSRQVKAEMRYRNDSPWREFSGLFRGADLVGGNFESAIGEETECPRENSLCFASPESSAQLLHAAGFRLVTVENNHSGDLGETGREKTREAFRKSGMLALDFDHSPQFLAFGDVTVALVAITMVRAADGEVQQIPSVAVEQKLRLARQLANLVIVSVHWGNELQDWPTEAQEQQASWLVQHGADLIVGHHPHVIQPPRCVEGKPVFFSLGNHLFDQKYPETKEGLIADCRIRDGQLTCGGLRSHTGSGTSYPVLIGRDSASDHALEGCTPQLGAGLRVGTTTIKPAPWSPDQSADSVLLEGYTNGRLLWRSTRQELVSLQETDRWGQEAMLLSLERHPSSIDNQVGLRPYVYAVGRSGLIARWRGSALAWPLLDAVVSDDGTLCALHRGDSFLVPNANTTQTRLAAYRWTGFGFRGIGLPAQCNLLFPP